MATLRESLPGNWGFGCLVGGRSPCRRQRAHSRRKSDGWMLLFNGRNATGWKNNTDKPVAAKIEDGALNPHGSGGYILVYDKPFGDFVLKCDVKMDQPFCNSGIFVRIGDLKDPVQSGLEVQVVTDKKPDLHGFGSIYDLVAPSKNASHGPGKWDAVEIRCEGPNVVVTVNGEKVASINCDDWREAGKRPDGTSNKFARRSKISRARATSACRTTVTTCGTRTSSCGNWPRNRAHLEFRPARVSNSFDRMCQRGEELVHFAGGVRIAWRLGGGDAVAKNCAGFVESAEANELLAGHEECGDVGRVVASQLGELRQAVRRGCLPCRAPSPGYSARNVSAGSSASMASIFSRRVIFFFDR